MKKYLRNNETISGKLEDELVTMDIEKGKYFSLNPVATRIWELLEKPLDLDELCNILMEEYEVKAEQCIADTKECLLKLAEIGLIAKTVE